MLSKKLSRQLFMSKHGGLLFLGLSIISATAVVILSGFLWQWLLWGLAGLSIFSMIFGIFLAGSGAGLTPKDQKILEDATRGLCVVLTCDQYLSLNRADPEKYPLDYAKIESMGQPSAQSPVKMISSERDLLLSLINNEHDTKVIASKQADCFAELQDMQATLGKYLADQAEENKKTTAAIQAQVAKILSEDNTTSGQGQLAQGV